MKPSLGKTTPQVCQRCGVKRRWLHRHHIKPKSMGGSDNPKNIIRICANCHEDEHGGQFGGALGGNPAAHTPKANAKRKATMAKLWKDPDFRDRHDSAVRKAIKKIDQTSKAEKIRAAWTPERRAFQAARIRAVRKKRFWGIYGQKC